MTVINHHRNQQCLCNCVCCMLQSGACSYTYSFYPNFMINWSESWGYIYVNKQSSIHALHGWSRKYGTCFGSSSSSRRHDSRLISPETTSIKLERTHGSCTKVNSIVSALLKPQQPPLPQYSIPINLIPRPTSTSVSHTLLFSIHSNAGVVNCCVQISDNVFLSFFLFKEMEEKKKKGLGLTSILKVISSSASPTPSSWAWASCKAHPRTSSFRVTDEEVIYLDQEDEEDLVMQGLRSERLFFDQTGLDTSSLVMETKMRLPFKETVAEEMESEDPFRDFRVSMEEMIVAHGLKDWDCLEELLEWYLGMNGNNTHGFILAAFVDLLLDLAFSLPPPFSCTCSTYSSSSCFCTCSSPTTTATSSSSSAKFLNWLIIHHSLTS